MGALIGRSWSRVGEVLFAPFSIGKWLRLTFVAFLAGALNFSGWGGEGLGDLAGKARGIGERTAVPAPAPGGEAAPAPGGGGESRPFAPAISAAARASARAAAHPVLLGVIALIALAVILFFLWLSARFAFVWLHAVRENSGAIAEPFMDYERSGDSLFKFNLVVAACWILLLSAAGAWVFWSVKSAGAFSFRSLALPVSLVLGAGVLQVVLHVFVHHFVVPIMAQDSLLFIEALGKWLKVAGGRKREVLVYLLVWLGLRIVAGIAVVVASLVVGLALLLVGGLLFGLAYLLLAKWMGLKVLFIIALVVLGVPFVVLAVLVSFGVQLPFAVFFRSFSLAFLSSLGCGYGPFPPAEAGV